MGLAKLLTSVVGDEVDDDDAIASGVNLVPCLAIICWYSPLDIIALLWYSALVVPLYLVSNSWLSNANFLNFLIAMLSLLLCS